MGSSRTQEGNSDNLLNKEGLDWGVCLRPVQDSTELVWYQSQFGTRKAALYGRHLDMTECSGYRLWSARVQNGLKRRANK